MQIERDQLHELVGSSDHYQALNFTFSRYQIDTQLRICHFMAQILHESGGFKWFEENLNYSSKALLKVFGKYFTLEQSEKYHRQPQKIANRVYANRMGNGDEDSGDGWKYRGRGAIQITGKNNYERLSESIGVDFVKNPHLLSDDNKFTFLSAGWYWNERKINRKADEDNVIACTKLVNGGTHGLEDRKEWLLKCKQIIKEA